MPNPVFVDRMLFLGTIMSLVARDRWPRERLQRHQAHAFERLRSFALARSPFYSRFHKGLERAPLEQLPTLTKGELMASFDEAVTDRSVRLSDVRAFVPSMGAGDLFRSRYHVVATSGTTGERGYFLYDPREWRTAMASGARAVFWAIGGRPPKGERSAMMSTTIPWHMSARMSAEIRRLRKGMMEQATFDSGDAVETIVAKLNAFRPTMMTVYPSMMQVLADEQLNGRLRIAPKRVQCSSEVLTVEAREAIEHAFHVTPSNSYAASECGVLGGTCGKANALHLSEDLCIIEAVDERGRAVPAGEAGAKVLLTVLSSRTLPLIRYELNDRLTVAAQPCACGLPFACLSSIEGRSGEVLTFATEHGGSVTVSPMQLGAALRGLSISGWQFTSSPDELVIACVAPASDFHAEEVVARTAAFLQERRAITPKLRATRVDRLARGATGKSEVLRTLSQSVNA